MISLVDLAPGNAPKTFVNISITHTPTPTSSGFNSFNSGDGGYGTTPGLSQTPKPTTTPTFSPVLRRVDY